MGNEKVYFWNVFGDMLHECGKWFWIIVALIVLLSLCILLSVNSIMMPTKMYSDIVNIFPNLLGFVITGFTILYGLQGVILERLTHKANDGETPFHVISAYFSLTCVSMLLTLILAILFKNITINNPCCEKLCFFITLCLMEISFLSTINIIFHLFALRTFFSPKKHK